MWLCGYEIYEKEKIYKLMRASTYFGIDPDLLLVMARMAGAVEVDLGRQSEINIGVLEDYIDKGIKREDLAMVSFGENVTLYRRNREISTKNLARKVGITQERLYDIEHGARPNLMEVEGFAHAFKVSVSDLTRGTNNDIRFTVHTTPSDVAKAADAMENTTPVTEAQVVASDIENADIKDISGYKLYTDEEVGIFQHYRALNSTRRKLVSRAVATHLKNSLDEMSRREIDEYLFGTDCSYINKYINLDVSITQEKMDSIITRLSADNKDDIRNKVFECMQNSIEKSILEYNMHELIDEFRRKKYSSREIGKIFDVSDRCINYWHSFDNSPYPAFKSDKNEAIKRALEQFHSEGIDFINKEASTRDIGICASKLITLDEEKTKDEILTAYKTVEDKIKTDVGISAAEFVKPNTDVNKNVASPITDEKLSKMFSKLTDEHKIQVLSQMAEMIEKFFWEDI